jgi:hypothetical protein
MKARETLRLGWPVLLALAVWTAALSARHGLVEPAERTARCEAAPAAGWDCRVRALVVQLFVEQRIGWAALGLGLAAAWTRRPWLAGLGLAAGSAGQVLYATGPASFGWLLSALVLVRPRSSSRRPAR